MDGFSELDKGGVEAGLVFGTRVPDSSDTNLFRLYLEARYLSYDYNGGGQDSFVKTNVGVSFPMVEAEDFFFFLEFGSIALNDSGENGQVVSAALRYQDADFNVTVGFRSRTYTSLNTIERRLYLTYDYKF